MSAIWQRADEPAPTAQALSARWFWLACAMLALLSVAPLWRHAYPALPDYPNHLARVQIIIDEHLSGRSHPYYALRYALIPNLALDTIVPLLVRAGWSTNDALRLFTALALLMPVAGVIAVARVVQGGSPWLALLAFPLAHSRYFAWGFLNYFFAVGLALLTFALWLRLRAADPVRAALALTPLGMLVLSSHLMGFGVLALLVMAHEAWRWHAARRPAARWRQALPGLAAVATCALLYLLLFERRLRLEFAWFDVVGSRLRNLASPFVAYDAASALAMAALLLGLLAWLARSRRLTVTRGAAIPLLCLVLTFALMPSMIMNSHYANARLLVVAALLFVAYAKLRPDRRALAAIAVVVAGATLLRTAEADRHWATNSAHAAELRDALTAVPQGAKVATVVAVEHTGPAALHPLRHIASLAVIDRQAFIPNFFGFPFNGEAVGFRSDAAELARMFPKDELVFPPDKEIPWDVYCAHYDAVLILNQTQTAVSPPCASTTLRSGPDFALHALVR
jgi:hypothetical protein